MPAASGRPASVSTSPEDIEKGAELHPVSKAEFTEELVGTLCTVFGLRHVRPREHLSSIDGLQTPSRLCSRDLPSHD